MVKKMIRVFYRFAGVAFVIYIGTWSWPAIECCSTIEISSDLNVVNVRTDPFYLLPNMSYNCLWLRSNHETHTDWHGTMLLQYDVSGCSEHNDTIIWIAFAHNGTNHRLKIPVIKPHENTSWSTFTKNISIDWSKAIVLNASHAKSIDGISIRLKTWQFTRQEPSLNSKDVTLTEMTQGFSEWSPPNWPPTTIITDGDQPTRPSTTTISSIIIQPTEILPYPPDSGTNQIEWKITSVIFIAMTSILLVVSVCLWIAMPRPIQPTNEAPGAGIATFAIPRPTCNGKF